MSVHRLIAVFSASALVGLLGIAQASNFAPPARTTPKVAVEAGLREKVQSADIDGCGG